MSEPLSDASSLLAENQTQDCPYCRSRISAGASVCAVCRSHLNTWRNHLVFWSASAGLLTLIASGFLFSLDRAAAWYGALFWKHRIEVVDFHSFAGGDFDVTVSNIGSGKVLVQEIWVSYYDQNIVYKINDEVDPQRTLLKAVGGRQLDYGRFLGDVMNNTGVPSKFVQEHSTAWPAGPSDKCYAILFLAPNSEDLVRQSQWTESHGKKLVMSKMIGNMIYYDEVTGVRVKTTNPADSDLPPQH